MNLLRNKKYNYILFFYLFVFVKCSDSRNNKYEHANDFMLNNLRHERFYLNQNNKKITIIMFWTTWCKICKNEMIYLNQLNNFFNNNKLDFITICTDPENLDEIIKIKKSLDIKLNILLDYNGDVGKMYGVEEYPTSLIINQNQRIVYKKMGFSPIIKQQLENRLKQLLAENDYEIIK